jgi:DNA-binding XRE family transcriptional regulator
MTTNKKPKKSSTKPLLPILKAEFGNITFGMFLRVARNSMDLSQVEMAEQLGISKGTLCDIEKGRQLVSPALAVKFAKKAGLSETMAVRTCLQDQLNKAKIKMKVNLIA